MVGNLAVNGLISGLDTTSIIDQLIIIQTQRITRLEGRQVEQTSKIGLFQQLRGLYLGLRTSSDTLKSPSLYASKLASSTDTDILSATATDKAALGSHTLTVKQLAAKNQFVSTRFADTGSSTLGSGTLTITVGTGADAVATDLTVDSTNNTLAGIEKLINDSAAKVTASIIKVDDSTTPYQLVITADEAGESNGFTLTVPSTLTTSILGETLGTGAATATQNTDDSDATTYSLRNLPKTGTTIIKLGTATITAALSAPTTGLGAADSATAGSLTIAREYAYVVSAVDASGETLQSTTFTHTAGATGIDFSFDDVDGATSYRVYRLDDTEYAATGSGGLDDADFQDQDSLIGTVNDDGSASFTFIDTGQAQQAGERALAAATQGYTLTEGTGAVVFNQAQTLDVIADYDVDLSFVETQAAKDAIVELGEGANALTIRKSTNEISDVIEGVTLSLKKVDTENPITVDVTRNSLGVSSGVSSFVRALNEVNAFIKKNAFFDPDTNKSGLLFNDSNLFNIRSRVVSLVTSPIKSIAAGKIRSIAEVGISLNPDTGNYTVDSSKLSDLLSSKPDEVRDFFAAVGGSTDVDVEVLTFTDDTKTSTSIGYVVKITEAATQGEVVGAQDISGGLTVDEALTVIVGGAEASVSLKIGQTAQEAVSAIKTALENAGITAVAATYDAATGKITLRHVQYGLESTFQVKSDQAGSTVGSTGLGGGSANQTKTYTGRDVAGTINGEAATGKGQVLTGKSGNATTDGLQIKVTLTPSTLSSQGASQGKVTVSRGLAAQLEEFLEFLTDESEDGLLQSAIDQANIRVKDLQDSIDDLTERAKKQREKLLLDFAQLEKALGALQTTSTFLDSQLKQIQAVSEAAARRVRR